MRKIANTEVLPGDKLLVWQRGRWAAAHVCGISEIIKDPARYRLIVVSQGEVHRIDRPHGELVTLLRGTVPTRAGRRVKVDRADSARFLSSIAMPVRRAV